MAIAWKAISERSRGFESHHFRSMKTTVADERMLMLTDQLTKEEAQEIAWKKKVDAFGAVNKVASFLSKPKDEDFKLIYTEHRYQPIWHIKGISEYTYDRKTNYEWPVSGGEVVEVTVEGKNYTVQNGKIKLTAVDSCHQEQEINEFIDGLTGQKNQQLSKYLSFSAKTVAKDKVDDLSKKDSIMVPPTVRISAIVREVLAELMKVIQADHISEEKAEVNTVDLYYRPVYAFQYRWESKNKEAIVEVDALTGEVSFGRNLFKEYLGKALDQNFLFDVGADAAGMFIPGGSIAVKVAKKYIDSRKK